MTSWPPCDRSSTDTESRCRFTGEIETGIRCWLTPWPKWLSHGVKRALAVVHAAYSSYSSCRQYREDIARAQSGRRTGAPEVDKVRVFYNHPDFIAANAERVRDALDQISPPTVRERAPGLHRPQHPVSMARNCQYEHQLTEACRLIAEDIGVPPERWALVYQSRSGRPGDPWLEPDILDHLKDLRRRGIDQRLDSPDRVFVRSHGGAVRPRPRGSALCDELGLKMVRARTVGTHPLFISMLRELIAERMGIVPESSRRAVGRDGPSHDVCPEIVAFDTLRQSGADRGRSCSGRSFTTQSGDALDLTGPRSVWKPDLRFLSWY